MAHDSHIPPGEFATALEALDPNEFASFVGAVWQGTADTVSVDPPVVTVGTGAHRSRLLAVTGPGAVPESFDEFDAVVTAETGLVDESFGPAEIRQRLLYGLPPARADEVCERFLGVPARSPAYAPGAETTTSSDDGRVTGPVSTGNDTPLSGSRLDGLADRINTPVALVSLLALLVLAGSGTALLAGGFGPGDGGGSAPGDNGAEGESAGVAISGAHVSTDERDWGGWEEMPSGLPSPTPTERVDGTATPGGQSNATDWKAVGADRYAQLRPTCNRSYLHVVQIQMNALKYNDNETNDGIRTVRRFASPQNREAVGGLEQYVRVITSPTYVPMLLYDSAEYEPHRTGATDARVVVVTRADGIVTGRYTFRMRKIEGGEYDGCWMTDGVQPLKMSVGSEE